MFNGLIFLRCYAGHLLTINTLLWLPLIFLLLEMCLRKQRLIYAVFAGLSLGCQILAGNPQYVYYTILGVLLYFVFIIISDFIRHKEQLRIKLTSAALFIFLGVGVGIAALRLIPLLEFTQLSCRAAPDYNFVASWSFPPQNLITYLIPEFFGDIIHVPYWGEYNLWEMCGYVGVLPLILSLIAVVYKRNRYTIFFACLALFALVISCAGNTPLLRFLYYFLPGFSKFRGHSKFLVLFIFSVVMLCAYGLSWLLEKKEKSGKDLKGIVLPLGIFAGAVTFLILFIYFNQPQALLWWQQIWGTKGWPSEVAESTFACALFSFIKFNVFVVSIFLLLLFWMKKRISLVFFKISIIIIVIADLWLFGAKYIVSDSTKRCYWDRQIVEFLKVEGDSQPYRVVTLFQNELFPNNAVFDEISVINGYDPLILGRYDNFLRLCSTYKSFDSPGVLKLFSIANLKYIIVPKRMELDSPRLSIVYEGENMRAWENAGCLPRVYIVHSAKVIKDNDEVILESILDDDFEPLNTVILERDSPMGISLEGLAQRNDEAVSFVKYSDNEVIIQAQLQEDGYLILGDVNYPGWRANVLNISTDKNEEVNIFYANYIFRGIPLKKGSYLVRFLFRPMSFYIGCTISALTILSIIISLIFIYRAKKYN